MKNIISALMCISTFSAMAGNVDSTKIEDLLKSNFFQFKTMSATFELKEKYFDYLGNFSMEVQNNGKIYIDFTNRSFSEVYRTTQTDAGNSEPLVRDVSKTLYPDTVLKTISQTVAGGNLAVPVPQGSVEKKTFSPLPSFVRLWEPFNSGDFYFDMKDLLEATPTAAKLPSGEECILISIKNFDMYFSKQMLLIKSEYYVTNPEGKRTLAREACAYDYDTKLPYPFPRRIEVRTYAYPNFNLTLEQKYAFDTGTMKFDAVEPLINIAFPVGSVVIDADSDTIYRVTDVSDTNAVEENIVNILEELVEKAKE